MEVDRSTTPCGLSPKRGSQPPPGCWPGSSRAALTSEAFSSGARSCGRGLRDGCEAASLVRARTRGEVGSCRRSACFWRYSRRNEVPASSGPDCWSEWLLRRRFGSDPDVERLHMERLRATRDRVLDRAFVQEAYCVFVTSSLHSTLMRLTFASPPGSTAQRRAPNRGGRGRNSKRICSKSTARSTGYSNQ
jgi:hypothetical protein